MAVDRARYATPSIACQRKLALHTKFKKSLSTYHGRGEGGRYEQFYKLGDITVFDKVRKVFIHPTFWDFGGNVKHSQGGVEPRRRFHVQAPPAAELTVILTKIHQRAKRTKK